MLEETIYVLWEYFPELFERFSNWYYGEKRDYAKTYQDVVCVQRDDVDFLDKIFGIIHKDGNLTNGVLE